MDSMDLETTPNILHLEMALMSKTEPEDSRLAWIKDLRPPTMIVHHELQLTLVSPVKILYLRNQSSKSPNQMPNLNLKNGKVGLEESWARINKIDAGHPPISITLFTI